MTSLPARRSVRLKGYDYASAGAYFITVCVEDRRCMFGDVVEDKVALWMEGQIVREVSDGLRVRFPMMSTDAFVVMPNHVHGIIVFASGSVSPSSVRIASEVAGAMNRAPTAVPAASERDAVVAPTLGEVLRVFKAVSTRTIRDVGDPAFGWQRSYYERVIRDDQELFRARAYIEGNAARWQEDADHPRVRE